MDRNKWLSWMKKVFQTETEEILCSECLDQVDVYVDREVQGQDMARLMPKLHQHLVQCAVCREEYELLHSLVESGSEDSDVG